MMYSVPTGFSGSELQDKTLGTGILVHICTTNDDRISLRIGTQAECTYSIGERLPLKQSCTLVGRQ
jgi:hypothetical protein